MKRNQPKRLAARAPASTARVELQQLESQGPIELVAVPSMRVLASWPQELRHEAAQALDEVGVLIEQQRAFATRPNGTCPYCASPLEPVRAHETRHRAPSSRWCPKCQAYRLPAGPRVGSREATAQAATAAAVRGHVEALRGKP